MKDDKINEECAEAVDVNPVGGDAGGGEGDIGAELRGLLNRLCYK